MTHDPNTGPRHRHGGLHSSGRGRVAVIALMPGDDGPGASHFRRRQLTAFIDDARARGELVVQVNPGSSVAATTPDDGSPEAPLSTNHNDAFWETGLARRLQLRGVTSVLVAGLERDRVRATCHGAKQAGFDAQESALNQAHPVSRRDPTMEDDVAHDAKHNADTPIEPTSVVDPVKAAGPAKAAEPPKPAKASEPAKSAEPPKPAKATGPARTTEAAKAPAKVAQPAADRDPASALDGLGGPPSPPVGASAEGLTADQDVELAWDDTWALRGEPRSAPETQPKGKVRGWLEKKARAKLDKKD